MPKNTNEKDVIANHLKYIGLDLEKIPDFLLDYKDVDFKPNKAYEENIFRVYRYLHLKDIQILLTPKNRLNTMFEKYSEAVPINQYLDMDNEENIIKHATLLKMIEHMNIEEIEKIEQEQQLLRKKVPFKVKYNYNYLWQIYYSEYTGKYFMLVTIEDLDYSCFFYLLKMQIQAQKTGKDDLIFVPVNCVDYTRRYLKKSEITDLEKYIWLFSKEWPQIYEVFDDNNELVMHIVGKTTVYDKIKTWYKTELKGKEEANKFYKLVKALFILQTELPHYYKFDTQIGENGELIFEYNSKLINYENLSKFIKKEYQKYALELQEIFKKKEKDDLKLEKLKNEERNKNLEYIFREKQVATYLECRTTVFGRIKYFFKAKNGKFIKDKEKQIKSKEIKNKNKIEKNISNSIIEEKEYYTIEDLIKVCVELDRIEIRVKNIELDIKALQNKIKNIEDKIKNATLYIEQIEEHKKSIFEFWKFANKDELIELNAGQEEEVTQENQPKLKKTFHYEEDFEDLGIEADKLQRNALTKKECDAIFITLTTNVIEDFNKIKQKEKINETNLNQLKKEAEQEIVLFDSENFDIFGNVKEDKTKISMLGNQKHREVKKDKFKILDISKNVELEEYQDKIKEEYGLLEKAIKKVSAITDINLYKTSQEKLNVNELGIFHINPINAIEEMTTQEKINLYKLTIKEGTNLIYFTNIIYYDNENNTLPLGMAINDNVLMDMSMYHLKIKKQKVFRVNQEIDEINNQTKIVCVYEYELEDKNL